MALTNAQYVTLKDAILTETDTTVVNALSAENYAAIADWYNDDSSFIVWKTLLTERTITDATSDESTTWDWTQFIATSVSEKMAWERMFSNTFSINPSLDNVRAGIADIFSGVDNASQRTHLLAVAKRPATRAEALYTTGTGTTGTPGKLVFEGLLSSHDITKALSFP